MGNLDENEMLAMMRVVFFTTLQMIMPYHTTDRTSLASRKAKDFRKTRALTESERRISIVQIFTGDTDKFEIALLAEFNCVVTVGCKYIRCASIAVN